MRKRFYRIFYFFAPSIIISPKQSSFKMSVAESLESPLVL